MCYFSPRKQAWSSGNFSSDGIPLCWQKHNSPSLWKGRQHEWNRGIHYATLWHYHWDSATKLRNECLGFIHIVFLFKVRAIMLLSTQLIQWDAVRWKIPAASSLLAGGGGGKSSTFWKWHCLRKIALESKRLIHTWWTWCQITWKRIFYPIQQKSMAFNQECRWNYGSKSLHSFWATLYRISYPLPYTHMGLPSEFFDGTSSKRVHEASPPPSV